MYGNGYGVPQDHAESVKWYRKAAEQGDTDAQTMMGMMYTKSMGLPEEHPTAYMFFNLSAAQGDKDAEEFLKAIEKRMTKEQIAEGQKLTREWLERKAKEKGE